MAEQKTSGRIKTGRQIILEYNQQDHQDMTKFKPLPLMIDEALAEALKQVLREAPGYGAWVNVETKLPPISKWVLAVSRGQVHMLFYEGDLVWLGYEGDWAHEVTHWMLLPDAP